MFEVHMLNEDGKRKAVQLADSFIQLSNYIDSITDDCRERSICKTKLEEACFFAKRAMAIKKENQE